MVFEQRRINCRFCCERVVASEQKRSTLLSKYISMENAPGQNQKRTRSMLLLLWNWDWFWITVVFKWCYHFDFTSTRTTFTAEIAVCFIHIYTWVKFMFPTTLLLYFILWNFYFVLIICKYQSKRRYVDVCDMNMIWIKNISLFMKTLSNSLQYSQAHKHAAFQTALSCSLPQWLTAQ